MHVEERRAWIKSRRKKRKSAQQARMRRQLLRLALLLTILSACCLGFSYVPWSVNDLENEIIVRGNVFTSTAQIRTALGGSIYTPVYHLDPKHLERDVESLETVKTAMVRRYAFPHPYIVVEVLEEHPWASLVFNPPSDVAQIKPGSNISGTAEADAQSLPPIEAVIAESSRIIPVRKFTRVIHPPLKIYASRSLKMMPNDVKQWATWVNYIEKQTGEPVDIVDMRRPFDVRVKTRTLALKLGIPDATLTQRLGRLISIMPTLRQYQNSLEYVDLALDTNVPMKLGKETKNSSKRDSSVETARTDSHREPM